MILRFDKEQIAVLMKLPGVQEGIQKRALGVALPEMSTPEAVLEYIGAEILDALDPRQ